MAGTDNDSAGSAPGRDSGLSATPDGAGAGGSAMSSLALLDPGEQLPVGWLQLSQADRDSFLPPSARELIVKGIPPNTLEAYTRAWVAFRRWCEQRNRTWAPVSQETMIAYLNEWRHREIHVKCNMAHCGHRPAPSSMWIWYSAVRFYHGCGRPPLPWECGVELSRAMIGYAAEMVDLGWVPRKAPRAYPQDVTMMVDALDPSIPKSLRDIAIVLTNFYTASRSADLGRYRITDVAKFPRGIELTLRDSKTNRQKGRKTEPRVIFYNTINPQYCGATFVLRWIGWLHGQGIRHGALFRPFTKPGPLGTPGVLRRGDGSCDAIDYQMDGFSFTKAVRAAACAADIAHWEEFTCHSLRRGRATQQRELGVDPLDIARAYGWVPGGAINVYLEEADRQSDRSPAAVGLL